MSDMIKVTGSCFCGDVKIEGSLAPTKVMACHCTDCQTFSGAPFRAVAIMGADDVSISGEPSEYLKVADSGNERIQGFCGHCGSQLYATDKDRTAYMVRTGCLEQVSELVPVKHIFGKSAASWVTDIDNHAWAVEGPASEAMNPKD